MIATPCAIPLMKNLMKGEEVDNEVVSIDVTMKAFNGGEVTIALPVGVWRKLIMVSRGVDEKGDKLSKWEDIDLIRRCMVKRLETIRGEERRDWWERDLYAAPPEWRAALELWAREGRVGSIQDPIPMAGPKLNRYVSSLKIPDFTTDTDI